MVDYNEDLVEAFDNKPDEIVEEKVNIDASFSIEDLLAVIANSTLDNTELIEEIRNSNEMEGIAFNSAEIDDIVVVIIGKKLLECTAKLNIEAYEKVTFITIKDESRIYVVPVKTNVGLKNSSDNIINPATEDKQDDIIDKQDNIITILTDEDFATEATLSEVKDVLDDIDDSIIQADESIIEINNKLESNTEGTTLKLQVVDMETNNLLNGILKQLKVMNLHLEILTDNNISIMDVQ